MRKNFGIIRIIILLLMFFAYSQVFAKGYWVEAAEHCKALQAEGNVPKSKNCATDIQLATYKGPLNVSHWGGEVTHFYYDLSRGSIPSVRIKITWIDADSEYQCGEIVEKSMEEIRDFTHRSVRHRMCK